MIEVTGSYAGTYYYHFDALGSVVALTSGNPGSMGNTVQVYEYDVYGRVGATDASHPNRIMFTGREFDKETGLYYYRARYYKPEIGRFLQPDPVGYGAGMNLYRYCSNNPLNMVDPYGQDYTLAGIIRDIAKWILGPGHITVDSSCVGFQIAILPEEGDEWITEPIAGQKYDADAVGFYADANQVAIKVPNGCNANVACCPVLKIIVVTVTCPLGLKPEVRTPGQAPAPDEPVWPPALPPEEKLRVKDPNDEKKSKE